MKEPVSIQELVEELLGKLEEEGFKDCTIAQYRRHYRDLLEFANLKGEKDYSQRLGRAFLLEKYNIDTVAKIDSVMLSSKERSARSKIRILDDYFLHGVIVIHPNGRVRTEAMLSDKMRELLHGYVADCERNEQSAYGIESRRGRVRHFLQFLDSSGRAEASKIDALAISDYVKTLLPRHEKSIAADLVAMRSFLRWLYRADKTDTDLSLSVPKANRYNYPKIPSVWKEGDIALLLGSIDRANPVGKRDFAILALAAKLGMRTVDIRYLRLNDLDFAGKAISFRQHKTKNAICLPMTDEIGWALADWLRNGRPESCAHDFVFSSVWSPFGQVCSLNGRIARYARSAGISIDGKAHHGMHSLRHSMASTLLVQGVSLPLITDVLGHMDPKSTAIYLHCNIEGLRACAIDPDEVADYA
jgi:site-specific recombinase XerD